jgi:hypothetical protein
MIAAIIVGPVLVVVTQFIRQKMRQRHDEKLWVFSNLMINRNTPLVPDFVRATNYIDVVFYKNEKIRGRWRRSQLIYRLMRINPRITHQLPLRNSGTYSLSLYQKWHKI